MAWNSKRNIRLTALFGLVVSVLITACTVSYKFNSSSIDYNVLSTISVADFPNQAPMVYPPLAQRFTETLKDLYISKTRLELVPQNGDLQVEGEITGYELAPMAVKGDDLYASETKLTITVRVRFTNTKNPDKDFEQSFSAYHTFDANRMLTEVQDEACEEILDELTDLIFNETVANW